MPAVSQMLPTTGRAKESGHWYRRDGSPCYEIVGANGKLRACDLRDARKLNLLPGVTTILKMEAQPMLERWKVQQGILAALTLPRLPDESDDSFVDRVLEDSKEQARKAAERGTQIHAAVQSWIEGAPIAADYLPYVEPVKAWLAQRYGLEGWEAERSFASNLGYGSKADAANLRIPCVLDFKCKDFGEDKETKALAYPDHCMQLAANRVGLGVPKADCANVFISTRVPGLIRVREWDEAELATNWEAFTCLLRLWQLRKNLQTAFA